MVYADSRDAVEQERARFVRKWRPCCKAVLSSFEEAGEELFTFLQFPQSPWKALRTTNALELKSPTNLAEGVAHKLHRLWDRVKHPACEFVDNASQNFLFG